MANKHAGHPAVPAPDLRPLTARHVLGLFFLAILFFLVVCFGSMSTVKETTLLLVLLVLALSFMCFTTLRDRIGWPLAALALVVLMGGISTLYAVSGKFALYEFLKVLAAFCLTLVLLAVAPGQGVRPGRWIAAILEGAAALAGLVSIDLISTRLISTPVLKVLGWFSTDYGDLSAVEEGVRMTSLFTNPNVFAGVAGIGVLLSLGLAMSAPGPRERAAHLVCLYCNALAFMLAFSMGASGIIAVAFLVYLALERKDRRATLLIVMVETLILTVAAAGLVSVTSFQTWDGIQPVPLLCVLVGAAALCGADHFLGRPIAQRLQGRTKVVLLLTGMVLAGLAAFALLAYHLTGDVTLQAGETLRRAAYPAPGGYLLHVQADGPLSVTVETQNQQDTMMHTDTVLYQGPASGAEFTVPEDSLVVYFNFSTEQAVHMETAGYQGDAGSGAIPLGYKLLPGFMSNRLQGLFANQNAIQRLVFFGDGVKLFQHSPVLGLGLGGFQNGIKSVQSFYYETKYAHNHYIQTLAETGVVGLILFVGLLAVSAVGIGKAWRRKESHPLIPALGAALVFMAGHAATEVVFSSYAYLPMAFGVFGLINLCCREVFPIPRREKWLQTGMVVGMSVLLAVYGVLLGCNMRARYLVTQDNSLATLSKTVRLDRFEWADYMLSYVNSTTGHDIDEETRRQADEYAARLAQVNSNTIPIYLAEYYLCTDRTEPGLEMVEKYVRYVSSDASAWQRAFDLLEKYEADTEVYRTGVTRIADLLENWNQQNMGDVSVTPETQAFVARMRA